MVISAWVCLIFFGIFTLLNVRKYFTASLNKLETFFMLISVIIAALSAGVIWGGLFQ